MTNLDASENGTITQVVDMWKIFLPNLDEAAFSVQLKLYQINLVANRIYNEIAGQFDLNDLDVSVLMIIRREHDERPIRPSDLWRRLDLRPSAITYRIDRLYDLGLIDRLPDPSDRRALFLTLTKKGISVVNEIVLRFNRVTAEKLADLKANGGNVKALDTELDFYLQAWMPPPATPDQ